MHIHYFKKSYQIQVKTRRLWNFPRLFNYLPSYPHYKTYAPGSYSQENRALFALRIGGGQYFSSCRHKLYSRQVCGKRDLSLAFTLPLLISTETLPGERGRGCWNPSFLLQYIGRKNISCPERQVRVVTYCHTHTL